MESLNNFLVYYFIITLIFIVKIELEKSKAVKNLRIFYSGKYDPIPAGGFATYPTSTLGTGIYLCWDPSPNATSYSVEVDGPSSVTVTASKITFCENAAFFDYSFEGDGNAKLSFKVRSINNTSISNPVIKASEDSACFPKGSKVSVFMNTQIVQTNIEDVHVGDYVIGAFGEVNQVLGLQRVLVGKNKLYNINNVHITTDHHPHITPSRTFLVCNGLQTVKELYENAHEIYDGKTMIQKNLDGLSLDRISIMKNGDILKTLGGSSVVFDLKEIEMDLEDTLYNLVVSGSHTYYVDEFAVTGWPSEKDFDYDNWVRLGKEKEIKQT